jgi:hypothetical protein
VYTPAHDVILRHGHIALDLNRDGIPDFDINHRSGCTTDKFCTAALYAMGAPYKGNYAVGTRRVFDFASALKRGSRIGAKKPFLGFALYYRFHSTSSNGHCSGSWTDAKNRYLGFKFLIKGKIHFGWARLNATCSVSSKKIGVLTGYAYETVANKPILAGQTKGSDAVNREPATLGHLSQGASTIPAWRTTGPAMFGH